MKTEIIDIGWLQTNTGQIEGVPKNPRFIRDERFAKLVQSIRDLPEMMHLREVIVYPSGGKYVAIGGNQRFLACLELGWPSVPCKVLPAETTISKLKEIAIKDNVGFGEDDFDLLNDEWDMGELETWGMELIDEDNTDEEEPEAGTDKNLIHTKQIRLNYNEKDYLKVKEILLKVAETPEMAIWKLLERFTEGGE